MANIKNLFGRVIFVLALGLVFFGFSGKALAATPTLSLVSNGDGDTVQVTVNGDASSGIIFYYTKSGYGSYLASLGSTNSSGYFSNSISSSGYGIASDTPVYVKVNGYQSASVSWPTVTTSGNFSLSRTGLTLTVGNSATINAYNIGTGSIYLSNNSNPSIANVNISGNQITVTALAYGSTVINICAQGSVTSCASAYVTVQSSASSSLTFSVSTVTVALSQSVSVTVSGGTGTYTVLNNSNSSVMQASLSGTTVTLTALSSSGTAAITICSSDLSACGIINATASTTSSTPVVFNNSSPAITLGQTMTVNVSGGSSSSYYISYNSNTTAVTATISGSVLSLTGNASGSATLTICSSSGICGTLYPTVSYTSSGGTLALSQTSISLLVGQVLSVTVSGGTTPYSLGSNSGSIYQASLNGNVITLSGVSAGSGTLSVCSAGGACVNLSVIVNSSVSSTPIAFSQNNLTLGVGGAMAFTISGAGGYYVSNSSNSSVASVQINGNTAVVTALTAGSTNISICQSGGTCAILFVTVSSSVTTSVPAFSQTSPSLSIGQISTITVSGGSSSNYYIAANSNPTAVNVSLTSGTLTVTGLASGSSAVVICAASDSCSALTVTVTSSTVSTALTINPTNTSLSVGQAVSVALTGGSSFYVYNNSNPSVATVVLSGSTATVSSLASGSTIITFCNSSGQCASLTVAVTGGSSTSSSVTTGTTVSNSSGQTFANGALVKDKGTIYLIAGGYKVPFASMKAFTGLGYSLNNVVNGDASGYPLSSTILKSATQLHPDGSWIVSGKVVFYVSSSGYVPVPTWTVFLNNGGLAKYIVKANAADLKNSRAILSKMTENDNRINK